MLVFGGMNDEKDYNDLAILQTRAAAKQLPPPMTDVLNASAPSMSSGTSSLSDPQTSYDTTVSIPAKYKTIMHSLDQPVTAPDFSSVKASFITRIDEIFTDLAAKYTELETQRAALRTSVESFQEEREANVVQYEKQQKELQEMLLRHKEENEEWIQTKKRELDQERKQLEEEKIKVKEEKEELAKLKEEFQKT